MELGSLPHVAECKWFCLTSYRGYQFGFRENAQIKDKQIGFGNFQNKKFVRLVVVNCENTHEDLMRVFQVLEKFANKNKNLLKKI